MLNGSYQKLLNRATSQVIMNQAGLVTRNDKEGKRDCWRAIVEDEADGTYGSRAW